MVNVSDAEKVANLRAQLPATGVTGYFNTGTNGPMAKVTIETMIAHLQDELTKGRIYPTVFEDHGKWGNEVRANLAKLLGGSPDEFAFCQSTNDGINIALNGLDWEAGDEVVTTNLEHPGILVPLGLLAHRYGVRTRIADIGNGDGDVLGAIAALVNQNTRVIAVSHVMWSSGVILDLKPIADLAHANGALLVVDGAQSVGQIPINLPETGADAYTVSGQKWLAGPEGSGAVWIANRALSEIAPSSIRYGQFDVSGYFMPAPGSRRFEMGENNPAVMQGLSTALNFLLTEVDPAWGFDRISTLGKRLYDALSKIEGVSLHSPKDKFAGLVCFNLDGMEPQDVTKALYETGFTIRYVIYPPGPKIARAAVGWWNTEDEVDALASEIAKLAASTKGSN